MKLKYVVVCLCFFILSIYLFVTAPPPLNDTNVQTQQIPIEIVLNTINREHEMVRTVYASMIVKPGKQAGLKFDEQWRDEDVQAGPLPAQFLKLISVRLAKSSMPLGLFLGSDFPISIENKFSGVQAQEFEIIRKKRIPIFFYADQAKRFTLMAPDRATSPVCVDCHNRHKDSTKKNWVINDVMGAVTFTYPDKSVSIETAIKLVSALRASVLSAYLVYIEKAKLFKNPPIVGDKWPSQGNFIPSAKVFMEEISLRASPQSINAFIQMADTKSIEQKG